MKREFPWGPIVISAGLLALAAAGAEDKASHLLLEIEGDVQVCFNISRDGYPRRIAVRRSTNSLFEKVAMKAVRRSTWQPLADAEELSGIKACRTFRFSLLPREEEEPDQASAMPPLRSSFRS